MIYVARRYKMVNWNIDFTHINLLLFLLHIWPNKLWALFFIADLENESTLESIKDKQEIFGVKIIRNNWAAINKAFENFSAYGKIELDW